MQDNDGAPGSFVQTLEEWNAGPVWAGRVVQFTVQDWIKIDEVHRAPGQSRHGVCFTMVEDSELIPIFNSQFQESGWSLPVTKVLTAVPLVLTRNTKPFRIPLHENRVPWLEVDVGSPYLQRSEKDWALLDVALELIQGYFTADRLAQDARWYCVEPLVPSWVPVDHRGKYIMRVLAHLSRTFGAEHSLANITITGNALLFSLERYHS
ncbi:hypothetical protein HYV72_02640 [Candidatus Uhrbacteria bacterium]|nr:hypothetical protein [Candidatus Uhrbacteria bacterium]